MDEAEVRRALEPAGGLQSQRSAGKKGPGQTKTKREGKAVSETGVSLSFGLVFLFVFVRAWPLALSCWTLQSSCWSQAKERTERAWSASIDRNQARAR